MHSYGPQRGVSYTLMMLGWYVHASGRYWTLPAWKKSKHIFSAMGVLLMVSCVVFYSPNIELEIILIVCMY